MWVCSPSLTPVRILRWVRCTLVSTLSYTQNLLSKELPTPVKTFAASSAASASVTECDVILSLFSYTRVRSHLALVVLMPWKPVVVVVPQVAGGSYASGYHQNNHAGHKAPICIKISHECPAQPLLPLVRAAGVIAHRWKANRVFLSCVQKSGRAVL